MLEEGHFSVENRPSDPTSSVRPAEARREFDLAFNERESKTRNGGKNLANGSIPEPRGQTSIAVVKPEEYSGKEYNFLGTKNPRGVKQANDLNEMEGYYRTFEKSGKKSNPKVNSSNKKPDPHQTAGFNGYYDSSRGVNKYLKTSDDPATRGRSKSFDKSTGRRPSSANKDRSRDYASVYSHYSSVYSRILNGAEANKIKKLVGEYNADLDVILSYFRANS